MKTDLQNQIKSFKSKNLRSTPGTSTDSSPSPSHITSEESSTTSPHLSSFSDKRKLIASTFSDSFQKRPHSNSSSKSKSTSSSFSEKKSNMISEDKIESRPHSSSKSKSTSSSFSEKKSNVITEDKVESRPHSSSKSKSTSSSFSEKKSNVIAEDKVESRPQSTSSSFSEKKSNVITEDKVEHLNPTLSEKKSKKSKKSKKENNIDSNNSASSLYSSKEPIPSSFSNKNQSPSDITLGIMEEAASTANPHLFLVFLFGFINSIDFAITLPSLYFLITDLHGSGLYFGLIFTCYNLTQFVFCIIFSKWLDYRNIAEILITCNIFSIVGNIIYFSSDSDYRWLLLLARCLCGVGGTINLIAYAHITRSSPNNLKNSRIILFRFVETLGRIFAPIIGCLLLYIPNFSFLIFTISSYNIPGLFNSIIYIIYFIILLFAIYWPHNRYSQIIDFMERSPEEEENVEKNLNYRLLSNIPHRFHSLLAYIYLFIFFIEMFIFWAFQISIIPLVTIIQWELLQNYLLFAYVGFLYLVAFLLFKFFRLHRYDTIIVFISLLLIAVGQVSLSQFNFDKSYYQISFWQILIGVTFLVLGFCLGTLQLPLSFTNLRGNKTSDLAFKMSWWFSFGYLGCSVGPIIAIVLFDYGSLNLLSHTSTLFVLMTLLISFFFLSRSSSPTPEQIEVALTSPIIHYR